MDDLTTEQRNAAYDRAAVGGRNFDDAYAAEIERTRSEGVRPKMTPEKIAEQMIGVLDDGRIFFRSGTLVVHGYAVDEPLHLMISHHGEAEYFVRNARERIAALVRNIRDGR